MTNPPHLSIPARLRPRRAGRWPLVLVLLAAGLIPHTLGHASSAGAPLPPSSFPTAAPSPPGPATVHPEYDLLPAAPPWKHSHGGPLYAYVISGHITISDNRGTKTYCAGSFFWEPPGHVHTLTVVRRSELFVLYILPPGATRDITAK